MEMGWHIFRPLPRQLHSPSPVNCGLTNIAKPKNGNSAQQLFNPIFNELTIIGMANRNRLDRGQPARHTKGVSSQLHNGLLLWPSLLCCVRGLIGFNCQA